MKLIAAVAMPLETTLPEESPNSSGGDHPRTPKHGKTQGREVPGFNHEGYAEAPLEPDNRALQTETEPPVDQRDAEPER